MKGGGSSAGLNQCSGFVFDGFLDQYSELFQAGNRKDKNQFHLKLIWIFNTGLIARKRKFNLVFNSPAILFILLLSFVIVPVYVNLHGPAKPSMHFNIPFLNNKIINIKLILGTTLQCGNTCTRTARGCTCAQSAARHL